MYRGSDCKSGAHAGNYKGNPKSFASRGRAEARCADYTPRKQRPRWKGSGVHVATDERTGGSESELLARFF
jgi:hypothetical protein